MNYSHSFAKGGVALVLVLGFLALLTVIAFAFFSSVNSELNISDAAASAAATNQLADSAINVVMGQIVEATKGLGSADASNPDASLLWASQPGMIRTFDSAGQPKNSFKLYSADQMVADGNSFKLSDEVPPNDWNNSKFADAYTDLNAPGTITDSKGAITLVYPIVDPSADGTIPAGAASDGFKVDGFSVGTTPGFVSGQPEGITNNRAAMPVKWLFVLKDGTLAASAASTSPAGDPALDVAGATKTNPIVGRVAFWADDETAKVNINTASEGTYWDMPRVWSMEDFGKNSGGGVANPGFAMCQPNQHEFQRYPGHPATTCLSPIFGSLPGLMVPFPYPAQPTTANGSSLDPYYNLAPRVGLAAAAGGGGGGSVGGTKLTSGSTALTVDTDRLYASIDELMFKQPAAGAGTPRVPNTSTGAAPKILTKAILDKARFFITAQSSAPETTLFNTPRVSIWPIWDDASSSKRTPFDKLSAFCSTVGGQNPYAYYFTRANPKDGTSDYTARNQQLYRYLEELTGRDIPGFGGNFLSKFGAGPSGVTDRDQLLTYIYDYIRCTNLQDKTIDPANPAAAHNYTPIFGNAVLGAGEVVPIRIKALSGTTQGFGRFYSVSEADLIFYRTDDTSKPAGPNMRAVFVMQVATPAQGLGLMRSSFKYTVTGLDKLQIALPGGKPQSLLFKAGGTNYIDSSGLPLNHGRSDGGTEDANMGMLSKPFADSDAGGDAHGHYPFFSAGDIPLPASISASAGFQLLGNTGAPDDEIKVVIATTASPSQVVQTLHFKLPDAFVAMPTRTSTQGSFGKRDLGNNYPFVLTGDSVLGVQVAGASGNSIAPGTDDTAGDTRMVESLIDVPQARYRVHNDYTKGTSASPQRFAHGLIMSIGEYHTGGVYGKLIDVPVTAGVSGVPDGRGYYQVPSKTGRQPDVPSRVSKTGVKRLDGGPGDWDTGWGDQKDGAHINKPDEGDTVFSDAQGSGFRTPYSLGYGQGYAAANNSFFSPTHQVPSSMMFGSLPTGVQRMHPWETLSFAPRPEDLTHPGNAKTPKDHLIADLFWMPVVEPWAISQPFATSGKINLNSQIVPFSYITRQSGLEAVMKSTKFAAIPVSMSQGYKPLDPAARDMVRVPNIRYPIDLKTTLAKFDAKFAGSDNRQNIFKSATQICEMDLYPGDQSSDAPLNVSMRDFWNNNKLTGDNLREKPYVDLYPRLTTKSNTFTVHVRVQALHKAPTTVGAAWGQWIPRHDKVVSEYRGSSILERYIDVNDPSLPDFATAFVKDPKSANIDQYYKMRVVSTKRFAP